MLEIILFADVALYGNNIITLQVYVIVIMYNSMFLVAVGEWLYFSLFVAESPYM